MSFVRIWVHIVFATKNRKPLLDKKIRQEVFNHIAANCQEKKIFLQVIDGHIDHVHCLVSLGKDQTIANVVQLIKGESAFWINQNDLTSEKFGWQDDYFAVSVSESQVPVVTGYIKNQEDHHSRKSFEDEVNEFMTNYGWALIKD